MYLKLSVLIMCEWKEIEEKFQGRTRMKKNVKSNILFIRRQNRRFIFNYYLTQYANETNKPSESLMIIYGWFTTNNLFI